MGRVGSWFVRLFGDEDQFTLEHRLMNAACLLLLVASAIFAGFNVVIGTDLRQSVPVQVVGASMGLFYYLARVRRMFEALVLPIFALALGVFVVLWFVDGGAEGGAHYFLGVGVLAALAVARGWRRVLITAAFFAVGMALFAAQYLHPGWIVPPYRNRAVRFADLCASYIFTIALLGGLVIVLSHSYRTALARLDVERAKSEQLLENVLPRSVSERLKRAPGAIADHFGGVTVLFADMVGFTQRASSMPPHEVVTMLSELFSRFDTLLERHGLEKIKTIGDAYMAVAGLPEPCADHAERAAAMALDMLAVVHGATPLSGIQLRIGMHSGPVVAGVIGTKKLSYDLWGDTVNVASRMESHAEPGQIQVTEATFALIQQSFRLRKRGRIQIKGRGELEAYILLGHEPQARAGSIGGAPATDRA